jgi:hypothetical protein
MEIDMTDLTAATLNIWIKFDLVTGNAKPFEVWAQVVGGKASCAGSYTTAEKAQKGLKDTAKRNASLFTIKITE